MKYNIGVSFNDINTYLTRVREKKNSTQSVEFFNALTKSASSLINVDRSFSIFSLLIPLFTFRIIRLRNASMLLLLIRIFSSDSGPPVTAFGPLLVLGSAGSTRTIRLEEICFVSACLLCDEL